MTGALFFFEYNFFILGLHFPLNSFELEFLIHMVIALSQLNPVRFLFMSASFIFQISSCPLSSFELEFLKHMMIAPLQLNPVSQGYVKVFQYWCKYQGGKSSLLHFFHFLSVQQSVVNRAPSQGLVSLVQVTHYFETFFDGVKYFEDQLFLVAPSTKRLLQKYVAQRPEPKTYVQVCFVSFGTKVTFEQGMSHTYKRRMTSHKRRFS